MAVVYYLISKSATLILSYNIIHTIILGAMSDMNVKLLPWKQHHDEWQGRMAAWQGILDAWVLLDRANLLTTNRHCPVNVHCLHSA